MDLKKLLPKILRNDFWQDFIDSVNDELTNLRTEKIIPKLNYWNIEELTTENDLLEIAQTLGYNPDLSLNSTLSFLRKEIYSIVYRIKNKSSYAGYYFSFKNLEYLGNVYILFSDNIKFLRSVDMSTTLAKLNQHAMNEPFQYFEPDFYYWAFTQESNSFDFDTGLFFDQDPPMKCFLTKTLQ